jgi:Family of unknown function (DUF6476)
MRALKILVYGMGVILVAGVIVLVVTIAYRLKHPRVETSSAAQTVIIQPNSTPHAVTLPAGAKIIAVQNDGDRVMLRLALSDGSEELMLLDWKTGETVRIINLK